MIMAVVAGRQAQLSFQAAVSQGVNGLLVSDEDSEANGSIQFQILQFAKLPSTLRHKPVHWSLTCQEDGYLVVMPRRAHGE